MQDNQRQHSGIDMARRIVSAARIAKAAAAGGVHGAAVAAAKEAAPFLAKLAIWVLVALIVLPMLIFAYGWLDAASGSINYGTNGMPDVGADQMYANAQKAGMAGTMDTMPELVGIALWKQGHIGVYIGNGYAVEAMGTKYGVVRTEVVGRGWQGWCRIPYIEYREAG